MIRIICFLSLVVVAGTGCANRPETSLAAQDAKWYAQACQVSLWRRGVRSINGLPVSTYCTALAHRRYQRIRSSGVAPSGIVQPEPDALRRR